MIVAVDGDFSDWGLPDFEPSMTIRQFIEASLRQTAELVGADLESIPIDCTVGGLDEVAPGEERLFFFSLPLGQIGLSAYLNFSEVADAIRELDPEEREYVAGKLRDLASEIDA